MNTTLSLRNQGNQLHQIQNILPVLLFLGDIIGLVFSLTFTLWLRLGKLLDWFDKLPSSLLQDNWLAFGAGFNLASGSISLKLKRLTDMLLAWLLFLLHYTAVSFVLFGKI